MLFIRPTRGHGGPYRVKIICMHTLIVFGSIVADTYLLILRPAASQHDKLVQAS